MDATTARLPWEMLALPHRLSNPDEDSSTPGNRFQAEHYIGTATGYGMTRQLRTRFAPIPTPAICRSGKLRVLIIADPAADAPLVGAQEEGQMLVDFFQSMKEKAAASGLEVEVTSRIGPAEASREELSALLLTESFDILHYAGHAVYDVQNPRRSGWIFNAGLNGLPEQRFTAAELARLDHVPAFVFSNACESGVTPERPDNFNPSLGPAFAEAFFDRGVRNLICTAWPVNDLAAEAFSKTLYEKLFHALENRGQAAVPMYEAMRAARVACASFDARTWGAYQHYGDPFFTFTPPNG